MTRTPCILVTGARGFLGTHIVARAQAKGCHVVASHRGASKEGTISVDVCDATSIDAAFRAVLPPIVIHCASYGVNYADQDPDRALAVNTHGSIAMLYAAARHGVARFIHIGSCFEYGHHPGFISEEASLNPTAIYGATKAATSLLMRERAHALGVDLLIARPFGIWGPGEPAFRLIPQVIRACLNQCPLKLTPCEVVRDYSYVEDIADDVIALALEADAASGTIVNIGSGQSVILRDFVLSVARLLDGESLMHFGELEPRPTEMRSLVADTRRLRCLLGDRPRTALAEGVRRMALSIRIPHFAQSSSQCCPERAASFD